MKINTFFYIFIWSSVSLSCVLLIGTLIIDFKKSHNLNSEIPLLKSSITENEKKLGTLLQLKFKNIEVSNLGEQGNTVLIYDKSYGDLIDAFNFAQKLEIENPLIQIRRVIKKEIDPSEFGSKILLEQFKNPKYIFGIVLYNSDLGFQATYFSKPMKDMVTGIPFETDEDFIKSSKSNFNQN